MFMQNTLMQNARARSPDQRKLLLSPAASTGAGSDEGSGSAGTAWLVLAASTRSMRAVLVELRMRARTVLRRRIRGEASWRRRHAGLLKRRPTSRATTHIGAHGGEPGAPIVSGLFRFDRAEFDWLHPRQRHAELVELLTTV